MTRQVIDRGKGCSLIRGNCLSLLPTIPGGAVDLVIADLPYGITGQAWDTPIKPADLWPHLDRICKPNAAVLIFGVGLFAAEWMLSNRKACRNKLIWRKAMPTGFLNSRRMHMRAFEEILVFYRRLPTYNPQMRQGFKPYTRVINKTRDHSTGHYSHHESIDIRSDGTRWPIDVLDFNGAHEGTGKSNHPTEKPLDLLRYLIRTYTNPGDLVLDPTCGSGSTLVAATQEGRRAIGIEQDPEFFATAERRLAEAVPPVVKRQKDAH